MRIKNEPEVYYVEDGCFKYTFDAKKVQKIVESNCTGRVLNLFAGKNRLNVSEVRVDISNDFNPDFHVSAEDFLRECRQKFDTIVYDPPWNERKSKELYNGHYIGKFTKLKDGIVQILTNNGIVISVGYEISNFGRSRGMQLARVYVINPSGEIRPYFVSIEKKITDGRRQARLFEVEVPLCP